MRNNHGSVLALVGASIVTWAVVALTAEAAFAAPAVNYNASKSNTGNVTAGPAACPAGETAATNPTTGKPSCVKSDAANYNSSKSNTGNGIVQPTGSGATSKNISDGAAKGQASE